jgi:hypothetical protein
MSTSWSKNQKSKLILQEIQKLVDIPLTFFMIFKNEKGTRFTGTGFELAKSIWKTYTVNLPDNYRTLNRTLLMLDDRMDWPYYLSKRKLVLFSEIDAFEFTLYQGDINQWARKD